jgi:hypothetical protein
VQADCSCLPGLRAVQARLRGLAGLSGGPLGLPGIFAYFWLLVTKPKEAWLVLQGEAAIGGAMLLQSALLVPMSWLVRCFGQPHQERGADDAPKRPQGGSL